MVILPATEADLQAVIELVAQGRAALAVRASTSGRTAIPRRRRSGATCCAATDASCASTVRRPAYAAFVFDGRTGLRPDRGGRLGRRRALCGGAPAGRGRALRAAGHCRRVAARSRPRGARARHPLVPHRHASRQRAHACAAREGGVRLSGQGALRSVRLAYEKPIFG